MTHPGAAYLKKILDQIEAECCGETRWQYSCGWQF